MTFIAVDPKSGKPKEYPSSAEFFKEVEEVRGEPPKKQREVKTFQDASLRLREEIGLDLRSPEERQEAADNEYLKEQIAEGVAEALQRQQEAQFVDGQKTFSQSSFTFTVSHAPQQPKYNFRIKPECGCKAEGHKPKAEPTIHSARGFGPIMSARGLTAAEAEKRLAAHGVKT